MKMSGQDKHRLVDKEVVTPKTEMMEGNAVHIGAHTFEKVEAKCSVVLKGFRKEGEAPTTAKLRIITEAEQRINRRGDIRAHFS